MKQYKRIGVLGDIHLNFCDWDVIQQAATFFKERKVERIISVGDLTDQKSWSRFLKEPDDENPSLEWKRIQEGTKRLKTLFPNMDIIDGNHDRRYRKKASEAGLPEEMLKPLHELFPVPGWKWHTSGDPLVVNGNTAFLHGDELSGGVKAKAAMLGMNVVQGHTHKAEIMYHVIFNKMLFGMDVGCMVNPKLKAFDYAKRYLSKVWVGFGYINEGVPHLIPKKR